MEAHAAQTRTGAGGLAQVDTHGLVVAAVDHRDSRTGDPNLHTHCAVSTKVRGRDGTWRSLDGRVLFALAVSASETYNAIEDELRTHPGVTFTDRLAGRRDAGLRAVREVTASTPGYCTGSPPGARRSRLSAGTGSRATGAAATPRSRSRGPWSSSQP